LEEQADRVEAVEQVESELVRYSAETAVAETVAGPSNLVDSLRTMESTEIEWDYSTGSD